MMELRPHLTRLGIALSFFLLLGKPAFAINPGDRVELDLREGKGKTRGTVVTVTQPTPDSIEKTSVLSVQLDRSDLVVEKQLHSVEKIPQETRFNGTAREIRDLITETVRADKALIPLTEMSNWDHLIIRDKTWDHEVLYNNQGSQEPYGRRMQQAVTALTPLVEAKISFTDLLLFAAEYRRQIAKELEHANSGDFGKIRDNAYSTYLTNLYQDLGKFILIELRGINEGFMLDTGFETPIELHTYTLKATEIFDQDAAETIHLSLFSFTDGHGVLFHTSSNSIPKIMSLTARLYNLALLEKDPVRVQELAAKMFWWICQAKPWRRGDPSIAELVIRSIFAAKKISSRPWAAGVIPWAEAMKDFSADEFARRFSTLFADPNAPALATPDLDLNPVQLQN